MIALCLVVMALALFAIWRGFEVRAVLFGAALVIGAAAGQPGAVFRRAANALTDPKWVLPICGAIAFAWVVRHTGCVDELVALLLRPFERVARSVLPGSGAVAFVINTAIPSQTSTLAAVGPLAVALLTSLRTPAVRAGTTLVLGASIAGELLNPGVAQVVAVAAASGKSSTELVVWLLPAAAAAFGVAMIALVLVQSTRRARARDSAPLPELTTSTPPAPSWRAALPLLPVAFLLASHPALPWHHALARLTPAGFEIFAVMFAGAALTIAVAAPDRAAATKAWLDGLGFAFAQIVTLIAVSAAVAKALEVGGVLGAFVDAASGHPIGSLALAFLLAFGLAVVSGSGVGPSVALVTALEPRAGDLGVHPLALGGALLFGAEAGRTTSPVAAVVLFGSSLTTVPPRALAARLVLPCLVGGAVGALACILLAGCASAPPPPLPSDTTAPAPSDADAELEARTREVILAHRQELRACYDRELETRPELQGHVVLVVDVGQNGRAAHVLEGRREGLDDEVVRCLARVLRTISFHDGAARTIRIQVPFAFAKAAAAP